jgi:hypothetical protein
MLFDGYFIREFQNYGFPWFDGANKTQLFTKNSILISSKIIGG